MAIPKLTKNNYPLAEQSILFYVFQLWLWRITSQLDHTDTVSYLVKSLVQNCQI